MPTGPGIVWGLSRPLGAPAWARYALASIIAAMVIALRALPGQINTEGSQVLVFLPAVLLAALYLGLGPAVLCLSLCTAGLLLFFAPERGWLALEEQVDITNLAAFVLTAAGLSLLIHLHRKARAEAEAAGRLAEERASQLEHEVQERRRAEAALRRSNADLEDFSHAVSHDLKEPLRGIAANAGFLLEDYGDRLGDDGRARLERLVRLPARLGSQLDALLEYARLGRSEFALRAARVDDLVAAAVEPLRPWLEARGAEVVVHGPLPEVRCDPARVTQVFANLITNGVKYNASDVKRVEIGLVPGSEPPVFFVRDNGVGIDPKAAAGVFQMFRRLPGSERFGEGSGSGLALCKRTLERHGGRIWFESAPGCGATFYLAFEPGASLPERSRLAAAG